MLLELKFDKNKIIKLSSEISDSMDKLHNLSKFNKKDFVSDPYKIASAKYFLIVSIEGTIDICNHLISMNKLRAPEDYADSFRVVGESGILKEDFVKKLVEMARFRNRLVHIYWEVDDELIYSFINEDISDIDDFIKQISNHLNL